MITWITALCNSVRLWAMLWGPPKMDESPEVRWQNMLYWRTERQIISVSLLQEPHEQYENAKIYNTRRWIPKFGKCLICYLGKSREITPKRRKGLGQSRNGTQLWMYLVLKIKSDAIKNNIVWEPGMSSPWIKENWIWSSRIWQEWTSTSQGSVDQNGWEWENLIQKAIVSTTVGKNTLEVEELLLSMKDSEMQYLGAISKTIEWPWFISKATHSTSQ